MKTRSLHKLAAPALASLLILSAGLRTASGQGTAFIYQGQLASNGAPVTGRYDMVFWLYETNVSGSVIAGPITNSDTDVSNGLFSVTLDFGPGVFTGSNYWLDISVSPAGSNTFVELAPRQAILPVPYSIYSTTAGNAATANNAASVSATNISGSLSLLQLPGPVVTNDAANLTLNGLFSGNGSGLTNLLNGMLALAPTIYMNFDSVNTSTGRVSATSYLASFGVILTNVTPSETLFIDNSSINGCATPSSSPNFLSQDAAGSPPTSFTFLFATPLQSVTFTRCAVGGDCATPQWTATAYAGTNTMASAGVCCINSDLGQPAHTYTLNGPGITSLTISANGDGFSAISSPPLDDFYLVPQSITVNGAFTATSFIGNGSSLTSLNPANLSAGTASINISGNAATATIASNVTGNIADSQLSANIPRLNGTNVFTGMNLFAGVTIATNPNNIVSGTFTGNAAGLTNLNAAQLTGGTISLAQLPGVVVTNAETDVNLTGTFSGNGAFLTELPLNGLQSGGAAVSEVLAWNGSVWAPETVPAGGLALFDGAGTNESFYGMTFVSNITAAANQTLVLQPDYANPNGNSGNGGNISILGGNAGADSGGSGGNITMQAGGAVPAGGSGYYNQGTAGAVSISGGGGYNGVGGNVTIASGPNSEWSQTINGFSKILLQGGSADDNFGLDGGSIAIEGGHNESSDNSPVAAGGNVTISGGDALGSYPGGNILILPGTGTPNGYIGLPDPTVIYATTNSLFYSDSQSGDFFAGTGAGNSGATNTTAIGYEADPHATGNDTAVGYQALQASGGDNTAVGYQALATSPWTEDTAVGCDALATDNPIGLPIAEGANTAIGYAALEFNNLFAAGAITGDNTAVGAAALANNSGLDNTAVGAGALENNFIFTFLGLNTICSYNTANGCLALCNNSGNNNIAIGYQAGSNITTNNNNIDIGSAGTNTDNGVIRIGTTNIQVNTYIAGIYGVTSSGGVETYVDAAGHLGTKTSSARFKRDIRSMGDMSDVLLSLRPVAFKYKPELDANGIQQFGLIAEEVQKVDPDLVVRGDDGKPYSVRYDAVNAMLLNEFLKEHQTIQDLKQQNDALAKQLNELETAVKSLETKTGGAQ